MKKEVAMYASGSFIDFAGIEHKFIVCALSTSVYGRKEGETAKLLTYDGPWYTVECDLPRAVFIGISVCNPGDGKGRLGDEWNEEKGKMIAYNKAKGFNVGKPEKSAAIFATRAGLISEELVNALLNREVQHVKDDPESVIPGYNQMARKYQEEQEVQKYISSVPENLVKLGKDLANLTSDEFNQVITVAANS